MPGRQCPPGQRGCGRPSNAGPRYRRPMTGRRPPPAQGARRNRRSCIHAAGFGNQGVIGPHASASARLMAMPVSVPPVKATPSMRGSRISAAPTVSPRPGRRCSTSGGTPAAWEMLHRAEGDERRLLRRLRHHGIAGGKCAGDLPGEDREGKIPGRDAGEHAAPAQTEFVALAGRALELSGAAKLRRASAAE